jgi:plastocyanin
MWRRRCLALIVLAFLAMPAVVAAQTSTPAPADGPTVRIDDFAFDPSEVRVSVGQSVTWVFGSDPEQHTVTPEDDGAFEGSGQLFTGDAYVVRFETPGTFPYLCTLHPFMTGTVTVSDAPVPTATGAAASPPTAASAATAAASATVDQPAEPSGVVASPATTPGPTPADDAATGGGSAVLVVAALAALGLAGALGYMRGRRSSSGSQPPVE